MAELKAKVTLGKKGDEAYIPIHKLIVTLHWTANVDLDLMAFYKTKDDRTGAVLSANYPGGNQGSLSSFPYIKLSQDAGVGARGGDNQEELGISKLEEMAEVYICTINYTDASVRKDSSFSDYDGGVVVRDDRGESVAIPLDATEKGHIAIIAKIDNTSPIGAKLINENRVVSLGKFAGSIPGAEHILG
ncbi:MAG: stress response protein [Hormoscilla sp.]